jgi:NAD(P)-dependent dehydrogenase (short-subunit alcohol dehydrogenase family)
MRAAVITGASQGLGRALAGALAAEGWALVIDARRAEELERARAELADLGRTVIAVAGDVADPAHRRDLARAVGDLGRLDLLVNNASMLGPTPLPALRDYPLNELGRVFDVNVVAPLALIQLTLPWLEAARGAVVNVTSDAAVEGYPGWGGYGATKAALEQLSNVLAAELRDGSPVSVYWVDPGDMRTEMQQAAFPGEDISDRPEPETAVPGLLRLVAERPSSGRYRAADLLAGVVPR